MHPDISLIRGQDGQQRINWTFARAAVSTALSNIRRPRRIQGSPLGHRIFEGEALGFGPAHAAVYFADRGTFVEVSLPVSSIPIGWPLTPTSFEVSAAPNAMRPGGLKRIRHPRDGRGGVSAHAGKLQ